MSTGSYWRNRAAPIIAAVIARVGREDERALRKALAEAYPFGPKAYHPYKIWLDEIKKQLHGPKPKRPPAARQPKPDPISTGQLPLFSATADWLDGVGRHQQEGA